MTTLLWYMGYVHAKVHYHMYITMDTLVSTIRYY